MKTKRIAVISIIASILLVLVVQMKAFADEPEVVTDAVNGLSLQTVFLFREGEEAINTFKVFGTESSGFDRKKGLSFKLEGILGYDRPLLYKAINDYYKYGKDSNTYYSEFDVGITFARAGEPYRSITYSDCQVKSYDVQTLTDGEEGYSGATKFAYIDVVKFDCRGFAPHNPVYEKMVKDKITNDTEEARKNLNHDKDTKKEVEAATAQYAIQSQLEQYFPMEKDVLMPSWVKQATKWAETGKISQQEYQNLIRYLTTKGIL